MNAPIDATHAESVAALADIRRRFCMARLEVAAGAGLVGLRMEHRFGTMNDKGTR
ncbi:MAG: hypothetical protein ACO3S5_12610 [Ilumatobacteraceae bacterium]